MSDIDDFIRDDIYRFEEATFSRGGTDSGDDVDANQIKLADVDLSLQRYEDDGVESRHAIEAGERTVSFDVDLRLECIDRAVCPHCGTPNQIPDAALLTMMETDPCCHSCSRRLGVVR